MKTAAANPAAAKMFGNLQYKSDHSCSPRRIRPQQVGSSQQTFFTGSGVSNDSKTSNNPSRNDGILSQDGNGVRADDDDGITQENQTHVETGKEGSSATLPMFFQELWQKINCLAPPVQDVETTVVVEDNSSRHATSAHQSENLLQGASCQFLLASDEDPVNVEDSTIPDLLEVLRGKKKKSTPKQRIKVLQQLYQMSDRERSYNR
jgi:hypothetical protein